MTGGNTTDNEVQIAERDEETAVLTSASGDDERGLWNRCRQNGTSGIAGTPVLYGPSVQPTVQITR